MDTSAFGLSLELKASFTYPSGITITQFPHDIDGFSAENVDIANYALGTNADLNIWKTAKGFPASIAVIPDSDNDKELAILFSNNQPQKGKIFVNDLIIITASFPNGSKTILTNGGIIGGDPFNSILVEGRLKSKNYKFIFQGVSQVN